MLGSKTGVICWVPILAGHNQIILFLQFADGRDDFVTTSNCQGTTRKKIVLDVYNEQRCFHAQIIPEANPTDFLSE